MPPGFDFFRRLDVFPATVVRTVSPRRPLGWRMRQVYSLLLYLLLPLMLLRLWWRGIKAPAYRLRWRERLGRFEGPEHTGGLWIHAVSVGESQAIAPLVRHLLDTRPDLPITITTTTPTGSDRVRRLFADEVFHVYLPYDLPFALAGFLQRIRPRLMLMVETEIWPNLLAACAAKRIPTLLANGRLSERSARGYARLGRFARDTFGLLDRVAAQSAADARRFIDLGVPAQRVEITGSIKFDMQIPASVAEQAQVMRRQWGHRPVWVAASTHEGEDELMLAAQARVRAEIADALLVLVPRHPERFERVANLCRQQGQGLVRRSSGAPVTTETSVFLGDTMGELTAFIGAADAVFMGGSLVRVGGHNMLEAAAQGVAVAFGPYVFNFAAISRLLVAEGAAVQVSDAEELALLMRRWLGDASERSRLGENGRRVVAENRGALAALIGMVDGMLSV